MAQKPDPDRIIEGNILVELLKLRERCLEMGFSEGAILTTMRAAPVWFQAVREQAASNKEQPA